MGLYGLHRLKAGLYLHRSGCFLLATDGWGPNENRTGWDVAVLDPATVGLVIDASWVNGTLRETVKDLDAALASDRRELPEIPTWETTGNTHWPSAASAPEVACPSPHTSGAAGIHLQARGGRRCLTSSQSRPGRST